MGGGWESVSDVCGRQCKITMREEGGKGQWVGWRRGGGPKGVERSNSVASVLLCSVGEAGAI